MSPSPRSPRRKVKSAAQAAPKTAHKPVIVNRAPLPNVAPTGPAQPTHAPSGEKAALDLLLAAHVRAVAVGQEAWQYAVERDTLHAAGVSDIDLRALVCQGSIESRREFANGGAAQRQFGAADGLHISDQTCFVLTAAGLAAALGPKGNRRPPAAQGRASRPRGAAADGQAQVPFWDPENHELWFGHQLVKRFKRRAEDQERILAEFQDQGWRPRIEDPLWPKPNKDSKQRLRKAIEHLNQLQVNHLIDFFAGGDGQSIGSRLLR